ncbi:hypothetical protein V2G26_000714 [Clonostachys chloroleuca]
MIWIGGSWVGKLVCGVDLVLHVCCFNLVQETTGFTANGGGMDGFSGPTDNRKNASISRASLSLACLPSRYSIFFSVLTELPWRCFLLLLSSFLFTLFLSCHTVSSHHVNEEAVKHVSAHMAEASLALVSARARPQRFQDTTWFAHNGQKPLS